MGEKYGGRIRDEDWMGPEKLRQMRIQAGMSREEAAVKTGLSIDTWHKLEQGNRRPGLRTAHILHELFNLPFPHQEV